VSDRRKRVLIVDDEPHHRLGIRDRLESAGYEVHSAAGGEEALELVQRLDFDLIALDLLMPQPNGFEVFRQLKKLCRVRHIPILILTVVGLEPQVAALLKDGAFYLQKQDAPRKLVAKVKEIIG
jgi:DNA-binding response OmpR family regulator